MKELIKYISNDDFEFFNKEKCIEHEKNIAIAKIIIDKLPKRPDNCEFSNGSGYIQHDKKVIQDVKTEFLEFVKRYSDHKWIQKSIDDKNIDPSWAHRIISDCCPRTISNHWYRFYCMDEGFREWGQPYYAMNDEGEYNQLNII